MNTINPIQKIQFLLTVFIILTALIIARYYDAIEYEHYKIYCNNFDKNNNQNEALFDYSDEVANTYHIPHPLIRSPITRLANYM